MQPLVVVALVVNTDNAGRRHQLAAGLLRVAGGLVRAYSHRSREGNVSNRESTGPEHIPKGKQMQDLNQLNELIDRAAAVAGSDYKLAKLLEVTPQTVSNWRHGRKPCPAADVGLMASVAGLNAEAWVIRAVVERHIGTAKGDRLLKALGKGLQATGAAIASFGAVGVAISSGLEWLRASTMYRPVKFWSAEARNGP